MRHEAYSLEVNMTMHVASIYTSGYRWAVGPCVYFAWLRQDTTMDPPMIAGALQIEAGGNVLPILEIAHQRWSTEREALVALRDTICKYFSLNVNSLPPEKAQAYIAPWAGA